MATFSLSFILITSPGWFERLHKSQGRKYSNLPTAIWLWCTQNNVPLFNCSASSCVSNSSNDPYLELIAKRYNTTVDGKADAKSTASYDSMVQRITADLIFILIDEQTPFKVDLMCSVNCY